MKLSLAWGRLGVTATNLHYRREFPSLSNSSQLSNAGQSTMWSTSASRSVGGHVQRSQGTPIPSSQQSQQDDFFSATSRLPSSNQGSFRFGSQASMSQSSQTQASNVDDFPPLSRNGNGEIGQDRATSLMSTLGFGGQGGLSVGSNQSSRAGNGLLNALNSRSSDGREVRSPTSGKICTVSPQPHFDVLTLRCRIASPGC